MEKPLARAAMDIERPQGIETPEIGWGSDAIAEVLRRCGIPYIALVPGASYRGLQDSLVNYLGNSDPQMLVCLHEEHAVAIAHGYAKVTGKAIAAAVHSNVGLMHASMAIFNAWCDRAPILILGATGPVDAVRRRPWIDWIHTSRDQGSMIRGYVKWDEQPASPAAGVEAVLRAWQLIHTEPRGPAYVCLDVTDQESPLQDESVVPDVSRYCNFSTPRPTDESLDAAAELLRKARRPVILAGRFSRDEDGWQKRIDLAESLNARVITDVKQAAAFPTTHRLHVGGSGQFLSDAQKEALREADLILSLDWIDPAGALQQAFARGARTPPVISATLDDYLVNGWSYDCYGLPPVDVRLAGSADESVRLLCERLGVARAPAASSASVRATDFSGKIDLTTLARALHAAGAGRNISWLRFPLGWPADETPFTHPLSYFGSDGGAGIGSGPGNAVGSALALKGSGRLPVAVLGDGDFAMGATAIWTAAHYGLPLLIVVSNNRSYFNDEVHQETVARRRNRPAANRWIGQRLEDPAVDNQALARSLGAESPPPVTRAEDLPAALEKAMSAVQAGALYVLDVHVAPGYASAMPAGKN